MKKKPFNCAACGGTGKHPHRPGKACPECDGAQRVSGRDYFVRVNARSDVIRALEDKNLHKFDREEE